MNAFGLGLSSTNLIKLLDQNERFKYTALHVNMKSDKHTDGADTVVLAEKTSFDSNITEQLFSFENAESQSIKCIEQNDIYYRLLLCNGDTPSIKLTIIHPATLKHIAKYTKQERRIISETPELYKTIVEPYIQANPASRIQWIQNILDEKSEMESLIFADRHPERGFYLLPDSKWDRRNISGIYLLAICKDASIRSIRDLCNEDHLALLKGIQAAIRDIVPQKYPDFSLHKLRCFIHYQPTYYHFHVHIVHVDMTDGVGALVGQAILLDDAIDNMTTFGLDFYQRKTLSYSIGENHELYRLLRAAD